MRRILALLISFCLIFEQAGFAQVAGQPGVPLYLSAVSPAADRFRPIHLRSISIDPQADDVNVLLDRGDAAKVQPQEITDTAKKLMEYFQIGLRLPNSMFWVNLRPDAPREIIDPYLEKTDLGRVLLEADLQLKKDLAKFTDPSTAEGKQYWDRLYARAEQLYGSGDIEIPTVTRPWIVPGEIILGESRDTAYVYKATLKVMLEQDYLKDSVQFSFDDERGREMNEYSSQLVRELIIPKLTRHVNASKQYAPLRQVYYSLILAQWFKARYSGQAGAYAQQIDTRDLAGLTSQKSWSKDTYFKAYQKSFNQGEYNRQENVFSYNGMAVRRYFSGGLALTAMPVAIEKTAATLLGAAINKVPAVSSNIPALVKRDGVIEVTPPGKNGDKSPAAAPALIREIEEAVALRDQGDVNKNGRVELADIIAAIKKYIDEGGDVTKVVIYLDIDETLIMHETLYDLGYADIRNMMRTTDRRAVVAACEYFEELALRAGVIRLVPGARELLDYAKSTGIPVVVITNRESGLRAITEKILEQLGLRGKIAVLKLLGWGVPRKAAYIKWHMRKTGKTRAFFGDDTMANIMRVHGDVHSIVEVFNVAANIRSAPLSQYEKELVELLSNPDRASDQVRAKIELLLIGALAKISAMEPGEAKETAKAHFGRLVSAHQDKIRVADFSQTYFVDHFMRIVLDGGSLISREAVRALLGGLTRRNPLDGEKIFDVVVDLPHDPGTIKTAFGNVPGSMFFSQFYKYITDDLIIALRERGYQSVVDRLLNVRQQDAYYLKFHAVMRELWMNALDSIRASGVVAGRIEVVVKVQNGLVIIKVIDNGAGLEEVAAGKIGERFSTKGTEGVGLLYCLQYVKEVLKGVLSIRNNTAAPGAIAEIVIPVDVPGFDGGRIEEITHDIKKLLEARKIDPVGIDAGELRKLAERIVAAQQAHQGTGHVRVDLSGISMPGIAADADRVLLGFMGTESAEAVILDERTNISALGMIPGLLTLFNTIRWLPQYRGRIKQLVEKVLAQQSELSCRTFAVYVNTALAQEESLSAWLLDLDFLTLLTEVGGVYNKDRIFESVLAFALTPGASAILSADETVELIKKHGRDSDEILSVLKALIESEVLAVHEEARTFLDAVAQSRHADSFADSIRALVESRSAGKENLSAVIAKLEKLFGIKSVEKDAEASDGQEETIDSSFEIKSVITAASGKKVITADNVTGALDKLIAIREGAGYRKGDVFRLLTTYIESGFVSHANFEVVAQKLLDAAKVLNQNQLFFPEGLLTIIIKQDQKLVSLFDQTLKSWERLVDEVVLDAANRCIAFRGEEKTNYTMAVYNLLVNLVSLGLVDLENVYTVKEQLLELLTKDIFLPSIPEDLCKRAARIQFESIEEMLILLNFMGLVANRCFTRELRAQILDTVVFLRTEGMLNDRTKDLLLKITKVADSQPVEKWRDRSTLFGFWLNLYILCLRQAEFSQIEDSRELYRQIEQTAQDLKMSYESLMSALMRGGKPGEKAEDYLVYLLWLVKEYESPEAARAITVRIAEKMGIASSGKATVELLREIDARLTPFAPAVEEIQTFSVDVQRRSFDIPYNLKVILRDKISQVLRNERGLAEEKLAEAVKALNVASALVAKLQAIPAQDADKFIEGLQELLGHDQVVADRQSIALMTEELVRARQEEADAFSARQQAQQTMEAARGAERKPAAEEYRQAKQRHEQARQKTRADFANARKKLNSILEKKVSNELVNMLTVLVLGKIERKLLSAYYDQTITGTDENVLMARLANAEGADNLLDDAMADIGLNRAFKQHIIAHAKWKMVLGQIVRDKERFLRNEQARTKGIHIELVFKKMNLLTVFQGKYAGTCLQDDVSDMVVDSSGNRRTGMFVINILADGRLAGAVLCDVFAGKLVLLGLDPSEFLVGTWEASAQELLVDEIMPRIAAFAEKNNLEFLIPPSGAGGLSNRSVTFANRIREYMDTGTAVKLPARRYHPIYKYTVDSAYPYKNKKDGGIQQINASAPGNKYIMITMDQQIDNILKASEEYGFTIAFVGGTARRMIARGAPTNGFSNVDMAVLEGDAYKVGDFKRYCAKHLKVKVDIPNFAPGDAWDEPWINPSNIYGGVDDLQTVTISRLMVSRKKDGAWVVSDGTANGEYIQDAVDRKIRLLPALQKEVFDRRLNFEGLLRLARIIAEYPDWEIDPALRQAMKKIIIPPDSEINLLNWMNEFFISQERKSFIRPVLTSFLKIFIHARSKDYAIGALRAIGPPSASLADIFGNIFDLEKAAEAMREAKETGIADEAAWFEKLRSTGAIKELGPDKTISAQRKKEQRHGDKWKTIDEKYSFRSGGELHVLTIETRGDCTYADEVIYRAFFSRQKTRDRFVSNVLQDANIKKKIEAMAGTIDALDANLSTLKHDGAFLSTDAREKLTERIKTLKAKLENGKNDLAAAMADGGLSEVFQRPLAGSVANFEQWAEEITRLYDKELTEEELAKTAQELGLDARQAERIKKQTRRMARILVDFVKSLPDDEKYNVFMLRDGIFIETVAKLLNKKARGFYLSKTTFKAFTQMGVKADLVIPRIILNIKEAMGLGDDVKIPLERYAEFKQRFKKAVKEELTGNAALYAGAKMILQYLEQLGMPDMHSKGVRFIDTSMTGSFPLFMEALLGLPLQTMGLAAADYSSADSRMVHSTLSDKLGFLEEYLKANGSTVDPKLMVRSIESRDYPVRFSELNNEGMPLVIEEPEKKAAFLYQILMLKNEVLKLVENNEQIEKTTDLAGPIAIKEVIPHEGGARVLSEQGERLADVWVIPGPYDEARRATQWLVAIDTKLSFDSLKAQRAFVNNLIKAGLYVNAQRIAGTKTLDQKELQEQFSIGPVAFLETNNVIVVRVRGDDGKYAYKFSLAHEETDTVEFVDVPNTELDGLAEGVDQILKLLVNCPEGKAEIVYLRLKGKVDGKYPDTIVKILYETAAAARKRLQQPRQVDRQAPLIDADEQDGGKQEEAAPGGIDMRALPITARPIDAAAGAVDHIAPVVVDPAVLAQLQKQWSEIELSMRNGPMPYENIRKYIDVCKKQGAQPAIESVYVCIAELLRMEEERAVATPPELKEILISIG